MYEVKTSSRQKKNNKLRWLATDINLNCYTLGVLSLIVARQFQNRLKGLTDRGLGRGNLKNKVI